MSVKDLDRLECCLCCPMDHRTLWQYLSGLLTKDSEEYADIKRCAAIVDNSLRKHFHPLPTQMKGIIFCRKGADINTIKTKMIALEEGDETGAGEDSEEEDWEYRAVLVPAGTLCYHYQHESKGGPRWLLTTSSL